jgi:glycosyltransferase involved in cell wall biosynthesis
MYNRDQYLSELKKSTALVLLLEFRAVSLVLLEALAAGMPVIVNKGASAEFARKKLVVEIADQKNAVETAKTIVRVLNFPQKFVPKNPRVFTWEEIADEIIAVFSSFRPLH